MFLSVYLHTGSSVFCATVHWYAYASNELVLIPNQVSNAQDGFDLRGRPQSLHTVDKLFGHQACGIIRMVQTS